MRHNRQDSHVKSLNETDDHDCEDENCYNFISAKDEDDESGEEQDKGYKKKERKGFDESEYAELVRASEKILSNMGANMGGVVLSNNILRFDNVLLQKRAEECAYNDEDETEEPNRVDKYHRCRRDKCAMNGRAQNSTGIVAGRIGELQGYLCKKGLGSDVGILLQARVTDSNKGCHRGREKTGL